MVATPKIRCTVVAITADNNGMIDASQMEFEPRFRPSDLVPWADPYISGLVRKLQAEVRSEREAGSESNEVDTLRAELEMPWDGESFDFPEDDLPGTESDRWSTETESVG